MSMTLNDEQAAALRAWASQYVPDPINKRGGVPLFNLTGSGDPAALRETLLHVLAPLVKPWRINTRWPYHLDGPDGLSIACGHSDNKRGEAYDLCRRLCDLLNESEGR